MNLFVNLTKYNYELVNHPKLNYIKYLVNSIDYEQEMSNSLFDLPTFIIEIYDNDFGEIYDNDKNFGEKRWFKYNMYHRDYDLPALILYDDNFTCIKEWYQYGKLHRNNDLAAIIADNNSKEWYQKGNLHRDNDLPAIIFQDGSQEWLKNGKYYRDNDLPCKINISAFDNSNTIHTWYKNNVIHRDNDKPAVII